MDDHFTGIPKRARRETVFFTRFEYLVGFVVLAAVIAVGATLHTATPSQPSGAILMSTAVIPAGIVMALMERRRNSPQQTTDRNPQ